MHVREREDAEALVDALREFRGKARPPYDWWTRFAYHYTDVGNARAVLEHGALLSRNDAVQAGLMSHDNAHQGVIAQSQGSHGYVRLYFRPLTPTQYHNEGIKPASHRQDGHCPVPVFFLFDVERLLCREGTRFSQGGLNKSSTPTTYARPRDLRVLPAEEIYSSGPYDPQSQWYIKDRRHAEIVTTDPLPLAPYLYGILTRSAAELETLRHLLTPATRERYKPWLRTYSKAGLFYRRWPFVESVEVSQGVLFFRMSPEYAALGKYRVHLSLVDDDTGKHYTADIDYDYTKRRPFQVRLPKDVVNMEVRLELDGCLAFAGTRSGGVIV